MPPFHKVLIANRGEIALRVMRTCKKLGYRTVAVFSDGDRHAQHVGAADEAVHIGPSAARESYLAVEKLIAAARSSGADAIHPGYGFLAENEAFAKACGAAGLVFIGPRPEAIELMGNKRQAKLRMQKAGVPCIPGYEGPDQSDDTLAREAMRIGLPVMVKAAAGGGGRGMRLVTEQSNLVAAIQSARSEATNAFASGELILERAVVGARHVEIQVFADQHGHVVHLGERDCSVQRRNQKIVEESPSPAVDAALRKRMGEVAVTAARAIDYVGAGTMEFLLAPGGEFYFMEMNTRLQVEHPVTELITGLDLVEWQLAVASGEPLPLTQDQVAFRGHAIEVRLCAEDPANGFLPQTGRVQQWRVPEHVRADHAIHVGLEVNPFYDSMLAKIIAWGPDRETARRRLSKALEDTTLLGVTSNRDLLRHILVHADFASGKYNTGFIPTQFPSATLERILAPTPRQVAIAAAALFHADGEDLRRSAGFDTTLVDWNSAATHPTRVVLTWGDKDHTLRVQPLGKQRYKVAQDAETFDIELMGDVGNLRFCTGSVEGPLRLARDGARLWLDADGATHAYSDATLRPPKVAETGGDGRLVAPMDGRIIAVKVAQGAAVKKGDTLVVLEAMKMEMQVVSDVAGTVENVQVAVGAQVAARQLLVSVTPHPSTSGKTDR